MVAKAKCVEQPKGTASEWRNLELPEVVRTGSQTAPVDKSAPWIIRKNDRWEWRWGPATVLFRKREISLTEQKEIEI